MYNARRNKPQVTHGGVRAMDKYEQIQRVSLSFAPVYHALNENATILPAARQPGFRSPIRISR